MPGRKGGKGSGSGGGGAGAFWLDRVIGALQVIGSSLATVALVAFAALSPHLPIAVRGASVGGAIMGIAHVWAGSLLFRGLRKGFVAVAVLFLLAPLAVRVGVGTGLLGKGWHEGEVQSGWTLVVLLLCVARLGGWGPKPR